MQAAYAGDGAALLVAAAAGDAAAVRELLDTVGPIVYGFVFARVGGDEPTAEDIVQDTLIEALKSAATFRGDAALSSWVCAIARRRLARHYAAERRVAVVHGHLQVVRDDPTADSLSEIDRRDEVVRALGRMPALHRQVLVLKYLDGRSVGEIAHEIGRSRVQVQSLLQRAREGLRATLEADDG